MKHFVKIPIKEFKKEHKELLVILKQGKKKKLKKEYNKQKKEMEKELNERK